jgi:hypothetical protein
MNIIQALGDYDPPQANPTGPRRHACRRRAVARRAMLVMTYSAATKAPLLFLYVGQSGR